MLVLFDLDGTLVDTESMHRDAYGMSDEEFYRYGHLGDTGMVTPEQRTEKKERFVKMLSEKGVALIPGAKDLIQDLHRCPHIKMCVVTNAPQSVVELIKELHPVLSIIPFWITREDYQKSKPNPTCFQMAVKRYGTPNESIIGFENSPVGLSALSVVTKYIFAVCPPGYPHCKELMLSAPSAIVCKDLTYPRKLFKMILEAMR